MRHRRRRIPYDFTLPWSAYVRLLSVKGCDIIQPDVCVVGGLLEIRKIAALAEAHYVTIAPHNPMGPLATMVNVHFAASTPNFLILEYHPDDAAPRRVVREGARSGRRRPW